MHCKIIQLSDKPIEKEQYIRADDITEHEWFIHSIADYVRDVPEDRYKETLKFCLNVPGLLFKKDKVTIRSSQDYYKKRYDRLISDLKELSDITLNDLATGSIGQLIWDIEYCYDDEYGDYIFYDGCLETIDSFVRYNNGRTFYVGGVVDYHF